MPRGLRIDAPGLIHHVTWRGVEGREIFVDDADRWEMLRRLDCLVVPLGFRFFAWTLMPNHIHFVLQRGGVELSRLMARLGTGYALYFNRRHERDGHLFQDRYWSRPLEEDLETVVGYVHRNPVRARLVSEELLHAYAWCGHGALGRSRPRRAFERGFAEPLPEVAVRSPEAQAIRADETRALESLVDAVCGRYGIGPVELRSQVRSRAVSGARGSIVRRAVVEGRFRPSQVADVLGLSRAAVSKILARSR